VTRWLGRLLLRLGGWRVESALAEVPGLVIVIAPHTSNWDFVWLLLAKWQLGLHPAWLGKHTLFRPPLGWFMRRLGGIPVDRSRRGDFVSQAVAAFGERNGTMLALAPEGTRRRTDYWKSGFYEIAREADVPVQLVGIDHGRRRVLIGPWRMLSGDRDADMAWVAGFFAQVSGRRPENAGPVRLRPRHPR